MPKAGEVFSALGKKDNFSLQVAEPAAFRPNKFYNRSYQHIQYT